jgi:hypothetical protein
MHFPGNLGWRYSYWTFGGLTLIMFLARLLFKLYETPKYLLGKGLDQQAVDVVKKVAARNKTSTWLTISHFEAIEAELAHQRASSPSSSSSPPVVPPNKSAKAILTRTISKLTPHQIRSLFQLPGLPSPQL